LAKVDGLFSPSYILKTFASLLIHYLVQTVDKPYYLRRPSLAVKNAGQGEEA
jgi:hypothetical protein